MEFAQKGVLSMAERIIFHVDANSAFLSWSAAYRVKVLGESTDLRQIPSVVAGDKESRHSIILARSTPAKKLGIRIILDGVFSHTGADSKYFNKYKKI